MKIDIKRAVSDNRQVVFCFYRAGNLYYSTEFGEEFAVPVTDCGNAAFNFKDKAILFMRWMRKHNDELES